MALRRVSVLYRRLSGVELLVDHLSQVNDLVSHSSHLLTKSQSLITLVICQFLLAVGPQGEVPDLRHMLFLTALLRQLIFV